MFGVIFIEPTNTKKRPMKTESVVNTSDFAMILLSTPQYLTNYPRPGITVNDESSICTIRIWKYE